MFWLISISIVVGIGLWVLWPLLQGDSRWKSTGLVLLLVMPALVYWQYPLVGSPLAMQPNDMASTGDTDASLEDLVLTLQEKLTESAADLEGWVLLARSYKSLQNFPAAVDALETANRLVPDEPVVLVELVEARLFASGNPQITSEMVRMLQQAVALQPNLQKGWWWLGFAAAQQGDDAQAVSYWQRLLQDMEPGSSVAQSVRQQISEAEARLQASAGQPDQEPTQAWQSPPLRIELGSTAVSALSTLPPTAALFLIARESGVNSGPPLAVKRIDQPSFPLELSLSDADSMLPQRPVSGFAELQLQARLSLSGEAMADIGDWQSQVVALATTQPDEPANEPPAVLNLLIDQPLE